MLYQFLNAPAPKTSVPRPTVSASSMESAATLRFARARAAKTETITQKMFKRGMNFSFKEKGCKIIAIALRIIAKRNIALATNLAKVVVHHVIVKIA